MFVISEDTIRKEFDNSSWDHDFFIFMKTCEGVDVVRNLYPDTPLEEIIRMYRIITGTSKDKINFLFDFVDTMDAGLDFMTACPDDVKGYLRIRQLLNENKMSPEDFEYAILGNIVTEKLPCFTPDELGINDIDALRSYGYAPQITKIVSNEPYTIVYFNDGTKSTVVCGDNDTFDAEKGVYLALLKKAYGNRNLRHIFNLITNETNIEPSNEQFTVNTNDCDTDDPDFVNIDDWADDDIESFVNWETDEIINRTKS